MLPRLVIPTSGFEDSVDEYEPTFASSSSVLIAEELIGPYVHASGYSTYSLASETTLYKGSPYKLANLTGIKWFAFDEANASQYGNVYNYNVSKPLQKNLLAMDQWNTLNWLYRNINRDTLETCMTHVSLNSLRGKLCITDFTEENIQRILKNQFGYNPNPNIKPVRASDPRPDLILTFYIRELGFQGYAIKQMKSPFNGNFHPEVALCYTETNCRFVSESPIKETRSPELVNSYVLPDIKENATPNKNGWSPVKVNRREVYSPPKLNRSFLITPQKTKISRSLFCD